MIHFWVSILRKAFLSSLDAIGQKVGGLVFAILCAAILAFIIRRYRGLAALKSHLAKFGLEVVLVAVVAWFPFFGWYLLHAIYMDHQQAAKELGDLREQNRGLSEQINKLQHAPPSIKTIYPNEQKRCWLFDNPVVPNRNVAGSEASTEAIIYCNRRFESPVVVAAEFDGEFIEGIATIPGAGAVTHGGGMPRTSRVFVDRISSPPVLAYQPVVVTVQSKKQLHAVRGEMNTAR